MFDKAKLQEHLAAPIKSAAELRAALVLSLANGYTERDFNDVAHGSATDTSHPMRYDRIINNTGSSVLPMGIFEYYCDADCVHPSRWWMARDAMRFAVGVYMHIDNLPGFSMHDLRALFVHPSLKEEGRIAYTASIEDGMADKQRVTTLGALCRRMPGLWYKGDEDYAAADAALKAELSNEITLLTGADIEKAWQVGPQSCMTEKQYRDNRSGEFWHRETVGTHPVMVYDAPGWAVAVVEAGSRYSQRAVTWVNPDNEKEKYYVRVYGSGPLERRLQRAGYKLGVPVNKAKLKLIPVPGHTDRYVMPYLDSAGGRNDGLGVAISDDGQWLDLLSYSEVSTRREVNPAYAAAGSATGGTVVLHKMDRSPWTTILGKECAFNDRKYPAAHVVDGAIVEGYACYAEAANGTSVVQGRFSRNGNIQTVYMPPAQAVVITGRHWLDHPSSWKACGFLLLDATVYPGAGYVNRVVAATLSDGRVVRAEDTTNVIIMKDGAPVVEARLTSEINRKDFTRIRRVPDTGVSALRHRDVPVHAVKHEGETYMSVLGVHDDVFESAIGGVFHVGERTFLGMPQYAGRTESHVYVSRSQYRDMRWDNLPEPVAAGYRAAAEYWGGRLAVDCTPSGRHRDSPRIGDFMESQDYWQFPGDMRGSRSVESLMRAAREYVHSPSGYPMLDWLLPMVAAHLQPILDQYNPPATAEPVAPVAPLVTETTSEVIDLLNTAPSTATVDDAPVAVDEGRIGENFLITLAA